MIFVDDDPDLRDALVEQLSLFDEFEPLEAETATKGMQLARQFGITGVPAMIVQGKYRTSGSLAGSNAKMIEVVEALIAKESVQP